MSELEAEIPRYQGENPYNYSNEDLAKRSKALKDIYRDFPSVNREWCKWLYDVLEHTPKEEIKDIMENNLWDAKKECS